MSTLEQVKQMQSQGIGEEQIVQNLQGQGINYREISEALSQSKITAAVEAPVNGVQEVPPGLPPPQSQEQMAPMPSSAESSQVQEISAPSPIGAQDPAAGMQQSIMQTSQGEQQPYSQEEQIPEYDYSAGGEAGYSEYQPYAGGGGGEISSDTITEISEQLISEKFSDVRKHLEKVIDFKNSFETKIESMDERLKRMEKIIDTLQSSVLRKVGDYVTNVDDIKKELISTQKSLSKMVPGMKFARSKTTHKKSTRKKSSKKK